MQTYPTPLAVPDEDGMLPNDMYTSDYRWLLSTYGDIVVETEEDNYQGSSLYLIHNPEKGYGYLSFGWGSCGGCDALQDAMDYGDVITDKVLALQTELWDSIKWFDTLDAVKQWSAKRDWAGDYSAHELDRNGKSLAQAFVEALAEVK